MCPCRLTPTKLRGRTVIYAAARTRRPRHSTTLATRSASDEDHDAQTRRPTSEIYAERPLRTTPPPPHNHHESRKQPHLCPRPPPPQISVPQPTANPDHTPNRQNSDYPRHPHPACLENSSHLDLVGTTPTYEAHTHPYTSLPLCIERMPPPSYVICRRYPQLRPPPPTPAPDTTHIDPLHPSLKTSTLPTSNLPST